MKKITPSSAGAKRASEVKQDTVTGPDSTPRRPTLKLPVAPVQGAALADNIGARYYVNQAVRALQLLAASPYIDAPLQESCIALAERLTNVKE